MANNQFPKWEEWVELEPEVKEYEQHRLLYNLDNRLRKVEHRKWVNTGASAGGGMMGGFLAIIIAMKYKIFGV